MRAEIEALVDAARQSLGVLKRHLDVDAATRRLAELNEKAEDPNLWDDTEAAQKIMRERTELDEKLGSMRKIGIDLDDAITLIELGEAESDQDVIAEGEQAIRAIQTDLVRQQVETLLSGEADQNDCFVEVHSGAGATESQDWASMLMRMYSRWGERRRYKVEIMDIADGEEAGIKGATLQIRGHNAYGWLKTEAGVHRLVRISPFDSNARRHTSFASVSVFPVIDDRIQIDINESDCRIDTFRASGAGGQHVNTTDSAVRITHIPTGIVVACQQERSQHKNRAKAWDMLRARMYEAELKKREEKANAHNATKSEIGWGHQIRSYVMQPYQLVKDLRTGVQSSAPGDVLDGDINQFIEAALEQRVYGTTADVEDID